MSMTIDEMIEVLQSAKEGKVIESRSRKFGYDEWWDVSDPSWNFPDYDYRVKKEPKEYYLKIGSDGGVMDGVVANDRNRDITWVGRMLTLSEGSKLIKVKEIIE